MYLPKKNTLKVRNKDFRIPTFSCNFTAFVYNPYMHPGLYFLEES